MQTEKKKIELTKKSFEDHGLFYANQNMMNSNLALSLNSGILYDIENERDVTRVSILLETDPFIFEAKEKIRTDSACWYGSASVINGENNSLIWEYLPKCFPAGLIHRKGEKL